MNMKKKILALAIASSLAVPQVALAAEDTAGMHYTSASEGFYASIRAQLSSASKKNQDGNLDGGSSRFGVHGTNDLGGGLEGFYTYEAGVDIDNGGSLSTRLGNVGLRGGFGEIVAGTFWVNSYNWTYGSTDIANAYSGSFAYGDSETPYEDDLEGRRSGSVQYTSPDLSGFQVSGNLTFDGDSVSKKNEVDQWAISAKYDIQGFSLGASYLNRPDALAKSVTATTTTTTTRTITRVANTEDVITDVITAVDIPTRVGVTDSGIFVLKAGYSQDNWYVNGWYGQDSLGDTDTAVHTAIATTITTINDGTPSTSTPTSEVTRVKLEDTKYYSIAAGVTIDKISLYALYENRDISGRVGANLGYSGSLDTSLGMVGVQYNLGSNSRVYLEYASRDDDTITTEEEEDSVLVGLRHDF